MPTDFIISNHITIRVSYWLSIYSLTQKNLQSNTLIYHMVLFTVDVGFIFELTYFRDGFIYIMQLRPEFNEFILAAP